MASSNNPTTEQPSSNTANQSTSMLVTLVTFPADIKCKLSKVGNGTHASSVLLKIIILYTYVGNQSGW